MATGRVGLATHDVRGHARDQAERVRFLVSPDPAAIDGRARPEPLDGLDRERARAGVIDLEQQRRGARGGPEHSLDQPPDPTPADLASMPAHPLFADLSKEAFADLARASALVQLGHGADVFRRGDPADGLYAIVEGSVRIANAHVPVGSHSVLAEGEVFGESCLVPPCFGTGPDPHTNGEAVSSAAPQRVDALEQLAQRVDREDAFGAIRQCRPVGVRPRAWQPHRRAVAQTDDDLRRSTEHHVDEPPLERVVPPRQPDHGRRRMTVVRSL
jgi:hypothetical protein